jgi:hypothetical protein
MSGYLLARRPAVGLSVDRRTARVAARADMRTAVTLQALAHEEFVARAKVHVLGSVSRQAVDEVLDLGARVQEAAQRNPFGAQLAADVARTAARELGRQVEWTAWRLG